MTPEQRAEFTDALWRAGRLRYMLHAGQRELYDEVRSKQESGGGGRPEARKFVVNISRRWGKSFLWFLMAVEDCLRIRGGQVRYCADTEEQVSDFLLPLSRIILEDCPEELRPVWVKSDLEFSFPSTGSTLKLSGMHTVRACDRQRGTACHRAYLDEAAFTPHLDYMVRSVLMPQCLTTGGTMIVSSTPPRTPAHDFADYCREAEAEGNFMRRTIYDAPHIGPDDIAEFMKEAGGEQSTEWKREYLCQFVVDEDMALVPEFTPAEREIVVPGERPEYCERFVVGDLGFVDLSFWVFCYWDFDRAKLVVEQEAVFKRTASTDQADRLRAIEQELWGAEPSFRSADAPLLVLAELGKIEYGVARVDTSEPEAKINALRVAVKQRSVEIRPGCGVLIQHLRNGVWNKQRTQFERVPGYGHFDGVAALMYALNIAPRHTNPHPSTPIGSGGDDWFPAIEQDDSSDGLAALGSRWRKTSTSQRYR